MDTYLSKCGICEFLYYELEGSGGSGRQFWAGTMWEADIRPPFGRVDGNYACIRGKEICAEGCDTEEKILKTGDILYVQVLTVEQKIRLLACRGVIPDDEYEMEEASSDEEDNQMEEDEQEEVEEQQEAGEAEDEDSGGEDSGMEESGVEEEESGIEEDEEQHSEYEVVDSSDEEAKKMEE